MVQLREAHKEDCEFIARMILMAMHIDIEGKALFVSHMKELVESEGTLYHWTRAVIAEHPSYSERDVAQARIGVCLAYDGCDYHERRVKSFSFVCSDGRPVAEGNTSALLSQPDESDRGEFYIDSLAVLPEYRGQGIGRMLLTDAVERGRSQGLTPSILVLPDNEPAVKLYESVGFGGNEEVVVFGDKYRKMRVKIKNASVV